MSRFECLVVLLEVPFILFYFVFFELNSSIFNIWGGAEVNQYPRGATLITGGDSFLVCICIRNFEVNSTNL